MQIVFTRALALFVAWLAGWLVTQVPGLDPSQAHQVAQVITDHAWSIVLTAATTGWVFLRRPGDTSGPGPAPAGEKR